MEKVVAWLKSNPVLVVVAIPIMVVGAFGIGILVGDDSSDIAAGEARASDLESELEDRESRVDLLREKAEGALAEADSARATARNALGRARKEARNELAGRETSLDQREQELDQRDAALNEQEELEAKRIIREDGIWQTDVDFASGTYRSTGGGGMTP